MWSTAVAIFAVGGMFGSVIGQIIANSLGRYVVNSMLSSIAIFFYTVLSIKLFSGHIF